MVTVFGLLLAPTMLPVLAGLTVRWLTWKGALTGFIAGLTSGVVMFAVKVWYLPTLPGITPEWASYTFEGISIFVNISITALGLWLGSVVPPRDAEETSRIQEFFQALDTPISAGEVKAESDQSSRPALGAATVVVGLLLVIAGLLADSSQARAIDCALGLGLVAIGTRLLTTMRKLVQQGD